MLLAELLQWGAVKKAWVVGERREHYEAETSIWKMVSRVFRERELNWIKHRAAMRSTPRAPSSRPGSDGPPQARSPNGSRAWPSSRSVGAHLLESMLEGEAVDRLPLKTVGELAKDPQARQ